MNFFSSSFWVRRNQDKLDDPTKIIYKGATRRCGPNKELYYTRNFYLFWEMLSVLLVFFCILPTVMWFLKSPLNLRLSLLTFNLLMILKITSQWEDTKRILEEHLTFSFYFLPIFLSISWSVFNGGAKWYFYLK